jgi:ribosomal protein S18 acetylase RimI-like enzyme
LLPDGIHIRNATLTDGDALIELWREAGLDFREEEVSAELRSVMARDPDLVVVAEDGLGLVASVFGAYDGRRGWVNRVATRADARGQSLATTLLLRVEEALAGKGCTKVNMLVHQYNRDVVSFYRRLGYDDHDVILVGKRLSAEAPDGLRPVGSS